MKTRKLRKKLTRKNRRKMKGGATITELKEQLGEVKEMIPNKIEEIKQNTAYKGVVTLAGEKTFEENLFAPLEELNKTIKKPIDKIEDKIKELESNFDEGKGKLKNEVETQFTELKTEFEKQYNSVIDELIGVIQKLPPVQTAVTTANMTGMSNPLDLFKTFMNQIKDQLLDMIDKKKEEILRQIDELTPDDILNKAVEAVKKSTEETAEKTIEKPAAEKNENAVKDVVEEAEAKLDKQTQEESSPDKAAKITAEKMKAMAETQGGKKKSKGKK